MIRDLRQIHDALQQWASLNTAIKSFNCTIEQPVIEDRNYPMMALVIEDPELMIGSAKLDFTIYFLDRLNAEKDNYVDVMSNMLILVENFMTSFFEMNWVDNKFTLEDKPYRVNKSQIPNVDGAIGWRCTFTIITPTPLYKVNVPV